MQATTTFFVGLLTLLLGLLAMTPLRAQSQENGSYPVQKRLTLATTRLPESKAQLRDFIRRRARQVIKQEESPSQLQAEFTLPRQLLPALDSVADRLGYQHENNLNAQDLTAHRQQLADEVATEAALLRRLEDQLAGTLAAADRPALQQQATAAETRLRTLRREITSYQAHDSLAYVVVRLYDEVSFPNGNHKISFVNMPGVEYGYLRLDNPKPGLTSTAYRGYAIKYHFTRGKSYFNLGVYKPTTSNKTDSAFVNELFVINFGQDFYPHNFGRGRRRYLNLYTSYQVGGFILNRNDDQRNEFIPNLNLGLGLELLKTRHVLLDNKASYFIPLYKRSRDLRGLLYQASFSFVF
ncbi:hypothetical protein HER32_03770 [Hymenobacter sp. BT18]|uniref:hypothetical protein n=1 Tax=Hymenobacter sp. BT18 TaxID=2835648 RepID=UPI00143E389F|nr:hypothetical protein [Hymenobacter sp. BT18]QIX60350.1 hypothetical protein HER32_03770 [Hymenobacter sp. BT18]